MNLTLSTIGATSCSCPRHIGRHNMSCSVKRRTSCALKSLTWTELDRWWQNVLETQFIEFTFTHQSHKSKDPEQRDSTKVPIYLTPNTTTGPQDHMCWIQLLIYCTSLQYVWSILSRVRAMTKFIHEKNTSTCASSDVLGAHKSLLNLTTWQVIGWSTKFHRIFPNTNTNTDKSTNINTNLYS